VLERKYSARYDSYETTLSMPQVEVGAIVDWRYTLFFDSRLTQWDIPLQGDLPTLRKEISFFKPDDLEYKIVFTDPVGHTPEQTVEDAGSGTMARYVLRDLRALPREPFRPPLADLSSHIRFVPTALASRHRSTIDVGRTWESVAEDHLRYEYKPFEKGSERGQELARRLSSALPSGREKADRLFRFVRDEIDSVEFVAVRPGRTCDDILDDRRARAVEKALLLQAMLRGVGLPSSLAWTTPRRLGRIDMIVPDLGRIERVLIVAEIDGESVFGTWTPSWRESAACSWTGRSPRGSSPLSRPRTIPD
jgi:transglutaminase-like putative cysteine protease